MLIGVIKKFCMVTLASCAKCIHNMSVEKFNVKCKEHRHGFSCEYFTLMVLQGFMASTINKHMVAWLIHEYSLHGILGY
jgi:hypothetical protein